MTSSGLEPVLHKSLAPEPGTDGKIESPCGSRAIRARLSPRRIVGR